MGTITDKLQQLARTKDAIKAAIIRMGQPVADSEPFSAYAGKITSIKTGVDTSDATAAAGDILSGKVAYSGGQRVEGTIPSMGAANLTASGATVTVPAGYYPSAVSKAVDTATQATPTISVSSSGLITASATQNAGYVPAGTKSATKQLTVQAAATITPGTTAKTAVASGRYTTGAVTVAGDANLVPSSIKSGVSIFGVSGTAAVSEQCGATVVNNANINCIVRATETNGPFISMFRNTGGVLVLKNALFMLEVNTAIAPAVSGACTVIEQGIIMRNDGAPIYMVYIRPTGDFTVTLM